MAKKETQSTVQPEFLVKYPQETGGPDPAWQLVGDAYRDGDDLVVGLSREFPAVKDHAGRLGFRMILLRSATDTADPAEPILRNPKEGERAVVRATVAGVDTPVHFGSAFPNNGKSVTLSCATLPPWQSCTDGGVRRILRVAIEPTPVPAKPSPEPAPAQRRSSRY